jgi:Tfp pilus assembly protein PilX
MTKNDIQKNRGFVILFAVTLSAILLSIALGVANVALKEIKFGTSAKDTNEAFFAADAGAECALVNDKSTDSIFVDSPSVSSPKNCNGEALVLVKDPKSLFWTFIVSGLGSAEQACAKVTVDKTISDKTTVIARGYNNGGSIPGNCIQESNTVEREIDVNY